MSLSFQTTQLNWGKTHRLINSSYPPIDLFEDIADPRDWDLLCSAESKTNPRLAETVGNLDLLAPERRVSGAGASYVMAPFTHISLDWQGRFNNGTYGAYYAANSFETALFEVIHHRAKFFSATNEVAGWITDQRELVGKIDVELVDIRGDGYAELLDPDHYDKSQVFASEVRALGENGIVYPSVRDQGGECFVVFYPDVISIPKQGKHLSLYWNGERVDKVKVYHASGNKIYDVEE
jgi:RES domain-containing protein